MRMPTAYDHRWDAQRLIELGGECPCCKATLRLRDPEAQEALDARKSALYGNVLQRTQMSTEPALV
jgi:hypothetical protein